MSHSNDLREFFNDNVTDDAADYIDKIEKDLSDLSIRFTALIKQKSALAADNKQLTEDLIRACAELSGIKKQEPVGYGLPTAHIDDGYPHLTGKHWLLYSLLELEYIGEKDNDELIPIYAKPKHEYNFYLSGIGTFYADSEIEITYLERLHGVGGKANLKEVT